MAKDNGNADHSLPAEEPVRPVAQHVLGHPHHAASTDCAKRSDTAQGVRCRALDASEVLMGFSWVRGYTNNYMVDFPVINCLQLVKFSSSHDARSSVEDS